MGLLLWMQWLSLLQEVRSVLKMVTVLLKDGLFRIFRTLIGAFLPSFLIPG